MRESNSERLGRLDRLFSAKTVQKFCQNIEVTDQQRTSAKKWLELLEKDQLRHEQSNYPNFQQIILQDLLGYSLEQILFETNNMEFQIKNDYGKKIIGIEAKGTSTDCFSYQHYEKKEQEKPILQLATYMFKNNLDYGICTNYEEFILVMKQFGLTKLYRFKFDAIKNNEEKLKEFIGIFGKDHLLQGLPEKIHKESVEEDKELTNEFYDIYHQTRLMLVEEFKQNPEVTKDEAIHYAQLYLNRLIFMFFAEDHGFVYNRTFSEQMATIIKPELVMEHTKLVCERINTLFTHFNKGSKIPPIFGFNGGLFYDPIPSKIYFEDLRNAKFFNGIIKEVKVPKKAKLNEFAESIIKKICDNLNPIIINLWKLNSYDFRSQLNVDILGHIFEQSISDLEEIQNQTISKRKKEGVYYTPEYVTDYICRNTIIPYLSKKGMTTVEGLVKEYSANLKELECKLADIKILDPACGSGAFLIKAVDILLDIYREIESHKPHLVVDQIQMTNYSESDQINHIIENSIYGVDLNDESVEITKLSLFLKLAGPDRKLIGLSNNIKSGNSIINNNQVHGKAFSFHEKFPEVMDERFGGFDIIIGNPPYIPIELMSEQEKDYYKKTFDGIYRKYDSSVLFVERVIGLLKENGRIGFIIPVTWQTGDNYPQFRRMLFEKMKMTLANIVNLPFDVFPDAYVDTGIMILNKNQSVSFYAYQYDKNEKIHSIDITLGNRINFNRILNHPDFKVFTSDDVYSKNAFNEKEFVPLGKITDSTQGIVTSKYPITNIKKSNEWVPFLLSADSNRYRFQPRETAYIDSTKIPNIAHLYINPKIMIRRIVNRQNRLMAFYEDTGIVTNKDYNPFIIITPDFDLFYILGLLNSRLFSYYYFRSSTLAQKDDFRQTTLSELRKLSIKIVEKDTQKLIAEKAEKMTQITKQYFDLKDKVLRRIVDNFNIKPSKKITNLTDMSFHEFKDEIERIDKRKIRLEEQDEWEKYFTRNINVLKDLKNQITLLDYEIDENVFDLYDITTDERIAIKKEIFEPVL